MLPESLNCRYSLESLPLHNGEALAFPILVIMVTVSRTCGDRGAYSLELWTGAKKVPLRVPVFYVYTGIKYLYAD